MSAVADLLASLALAHDPEPDGGQGYVGNDYTAIDPACRTCGTPDEYAVPWPCRTRKLIDELRVALGLPA